MSHRGRRYFSLITISAGLLATSVSSSGADPGIGYSTAITVPPHAASRPIVSHPTDLPGTNSDRSLQRVRIVDRLYEETMRSSGCFLAARNASITGGC
jgi:hypothetical protein